MLFIIRYASVNKLLGLPSVLNASFVGVVRIYFDKQKTICFHSISISLHFTDSLHEHAGSRPKR